MTMNKFILIEYNNMPYPKGFNSEIKEIAGHLDKNEIETAEKCSLHTEYSYRCINNTAVDTFRTDCGVVISINHFSKAAMASFIA